ncbi:Bromodomain-containing protein [Aspergillus ambiguus]|uniref:putative transcription regulator BDF1 n=1 Tax=Aspergillus ambiguus TaxID=176160 RepID=UPI003CCD0075
MNGHNTETNGVDTTASPPKSPTADSKPSAMDTSVGDEPKNEAGDNGDATAPASSSAPDAGVAPSKDTPTPQVSGKPTEAATDVTTDDKPQPPTQDAPSAMTAEIPHHTSNIAKTDGTPNPDAGSAPSVPSLQTVDQEMRDAPVEAPPSPTKMPREREPDAADEPAAKRTKIEGESSAPVEFKVPPVPQATTGAPAAPATPATPAAAATNGESAITKVQHKFILKGIQSLKRMNDSRFYREPVDPVKLNIPHYPQIIQRPMDLGTIERKLKNNQYSSVQGVVDDFNLMIQNAVTFNGPDHLVSQEGQRLKGTFEKQMMNLPKPGEVEEKKPKKISPKTSAASREPRTSTGGASRPAGGSPQATTFALGPEGLPLIRRDSTTADGRPKRSIHPPKRDLPYSTKPKKKKYQWELRFCQEVLDEIHKPKHYNYAMPFYYPVDPVALNIPTYHSIIKKPMDLMTMKNKLSTGQYENAKEFETDMRQMFKNCFKFNIPGDPTYVAGQALEQMFNSKWAQKSRYLEAHEPHPEHHSAEDTSESSEEEVEESDEDDEKVNLLKKQMAEMNRQLEALQKKKKTPPGTKKSSKSKPGKKESKKSGASSGSKKDKKSKSSKYGKEREITYSEKQIISNGISSLTDKKMQEALRIIQNNVPNLKGTQETEIELDIDELPNEVLWMLLRFVRKNAPHVMESEDIATPTAMNAPAPKPKKNKPMSKYEQEAQINMLESNLSRFQGGDHSPDPVPSVEANESSDDDSDDDSEESEEE